MTAIADEKKMDDKLKTRWQLRPPRVDPTHVLGGDIRFALSGLGHGREEEKKEGHFNLIRHLFDEPINKSIWYSIRSMKIDKKMADVRSESSLLGVDSNEGNREGGCLERHARKRRKHPPDAEGGRDLDLDDLFCFRDFQIILLGQHDK